MDLLARTKLSPNQSQVLHALLAIGEPCSQKKLIEKTGLDKTGVSKAVKSLLKSSIVVNTNNYHKKTSSIVVSSNNFLVVSSNNYQEKSSCTSALTNSEMNDILVNLSVDKSISVEESISCNSSLFTMLKPLYIGKNHAKPEGESAPPSDKFDEFWKLYPRKTAKKDARKAWKQMKCDNPDLFDSLMAALRKQLDITWKDKDKEYIPLPATWLRGERWDDEIYENGKDGSMSDDEYLRRWMK